MSRFYYIASSYELPLGERGGIFHTLPYSEWITSPEYLANQEKQRADGMVPLTDIVDFSTFADRNIIVYKTQEDAAGIFIQEIPRWAGVLQKHFHHPFIYMISPESGDFNIEADPDQYEDLDAYRASLKCCRELFKLMEEYRGDAEDFELYTCWSGEEDEPRNIKLDRVIDLNTYDVAQQGFEMLEKQYVLVKLPMLHHEIE
ncbi:hypothetical protein QCD85_20865 [Paenibacillus sp. PsM32]|uniref:hypothetical protein n=1 Tax=Paenibacillus sp. PsM32 TaxID=3030536 RepID=UPI00263ABC18|nr:hypothetical protein [Paenibacillus sp. PsM32]MDN4620581.1 hypothetical protein [Paenibacillus sp. PsM32]